MIFESSDRWRRAVDRFAPAMLPGGFERWSATLAEAGAVDLSAAEMPLVHLYEVGAVNPRATLHAIASGAAADHPPLQLVALDPGLRIDDVGRCELAAALREMGAAAVLRHPEQLPMAGRLVAGYVRAWSVRETRRL